MNTHPNAAYVELAHLPITKMQDVLLARFIGRDEGGKLGFGPEMLTRIATVISETTRNVIQHAGAPGEFRLGKLTDGEARGLRIVVSDAGKGIDHPERFLSSSKSTAVGAGLPGSQKLADHFELQSAPGAGTVITLELWLRT